MGTSKLLWGQPDKMLGGNLRWTSIPSRGSRNTPSRFILQKPEIRDRSLFIAWGGGGGAEDLGGDQMVI